MIAAFFLSGLFRNHSSGETESQKDVSTEDFLDTYGISENSMDAHMSDVEVTSLNDVLPQDSLISPTNEMEKREFEHRIKLRNVILYSLIMPMAIIPIWLMILLTIPVFDRDSDVSEPMQLAYLTAVASDFIGLYYIITRDLFPNGRQTGRRKPRK